MVRIYLITIAVALVVTGIFMAGVYKSFTLLSFINAAGVAGILFIVAGCVLLVVGGGFFNGIAYSFKRFFDKATRTGEMIASLTEEEPEDKNEPLYRTENESYTMTYPLMVVGVLLFIVSLILSYVFY